MSLVNRYEAWFSKLTKNLTCSKGQEGAVLLSRVSMLKLEEGVLGGFVHIQTFKSVVEDFSKDRKNLRWVEKLIRDTERWQKTFEATLRVTMISEQNIVEAFVEGKINVDLAIGLLDG